MIFISSLTRSLFDTAILPTSIQDDVGTGVLFTYVGTTSFRGARWDGPVRMTERCPRCGSTGWVCEIHMKRPWTGPGACGCGAPGAPCGRCNDPGDGETPRMLNGFKPVIDKNGWRN